MAGGPTRVGLAANYRQILTSTSKPKEGRGDDCRRRRTGRQATELVDEVRKIREAQGLSQRRPAKLADVDRVSLLRFEKGDSARQPRHGREVAEVHTLVIGREVCAIDCTAFLDPALRGGAGLSL